MADVPPPAGANPTGETSTTDNAHQDDAHQDADLADSLQGLSRLAVGNGQQGLESMLTHVANFAVGAIPGADGAGLTLLENDRHDTIVTSSPFVAEVDDIQYGIGEGPCITAAAEGRTVRSGSLGGDPSWPRFGPRVGRLGVHSVLSLPLISDGTVIGAMNVYAHTKNAFDDRAVALGELYAIPAAVSVLNAQSLHQAQRLAAQLQHALSSRATVDRALGIIMSRVGCSPDEAFARLRALSQNEHVKLAVIAERLVDEAAARARSRRTKP